METRNKITELDSIEVLKVVNQKVAFPKHYHETYCITLIESGLEAIQAEGATIISEKGIITITNPCEVHANPIVDKDMVNSFTTIYLSPDIVEYYLGKKDLIFSHQQFLNIESIRSFRETVKTIKQANIEKMESNLGSLVHSFKREEKSITENTKYSNRQWKELMLLIENSLRNKITLDFLSRFINMNKYNFAKEFRLKFGLSPINYIIMRRIFKAKQLIVKSTNLTQLAYEFSFSDQAHFSKQFKRFVGMSPIAYKNQLS